MINASDLINTPNRNDEKKDSNFKDLNKTNISFVRIACHFHEVFKIEKYLKELKKNKNLKLFINVMQISEIKKSNQKNMQIFKFLF